MEIITSKVIHVWWLHVNNIKTLATDLKVPQVYSEVICRDERLPIPVHSSESKLSLEQ